VQRIVDMQKTDPLLRSEQGKELAQPHVDRKVCAFRPSGFILSENENHDH